MSVVEWWLVLPVEGGRRQQQVGIRGSAADLVLLDPDGNEETGQAPTYTETRCGL